MRNGVISDWLCSTRCASPKASGQEATPAWLRWGLRGWRLAQQLQRVLCHSISPAVLHMAGASGFRRVGGNPAAPLVLDIPVG